MREGWSAKTSADAKREGTCGRICNACGRRLDEHERGPRVMVIGRSRGRARFPAVKVTPYGCRVRLIQQSPVTGGVSVPATGQRSKPLNTRYVHESRLQPGGDLHVQS